MESFISQSFRQRIRVWLCLRILRDEQGSVLPLILGFFILLFLFVAGIAAGSAAFLAQRDLQSDCDSAALAAVSGIDEQGLLESGVAVDQRVLVASEVVAQAVAQYQAEVASQNGMIIAIQVREKELTLTCRRKVQIPFGSLFGKGEGLNRTVTSTSDMVIRE